MKTKTNVKRPQIRALKIQSKYRKAKRRYTLVPEIKLCGNWLHESGFERGQCVSAAAMKQLLIIQVAKE